MESKIQPHINYPADYAFETLNDFVHDATTSFEDLQNLVLGIAREPHLRLPADESLHPEKIWTGPSSEMVSTSETNESAEGEWRISDLLYSIEVNKLKPETIDLRTFNFSTQYFQCPDIWEFMRHLRHVLEADSNRPIVLSHKGQVLDGRHRIVKAIMFEGRSTIQAFRLRSDMSPTR